MFNSILARVLALTFGLLVLTLAGLIVIMQTPLSSRIFDRAITESADSIAELVWLIETSPPEAEGAILSTYASRSRIAWIADGFSGELASDRARQALLTGTDNAVAQRLRERDIRFDEVGALELARRSGANPDIFYNTSSALQMAVALEDGRALNIWLAPSIFYTEAAYAPYFLIAVVLVVTVLLGFALHAVIMRPIRVLEHDAELVGLAETAVPVSETGPRELRRLAQALNRMRLRLDGLIREREQIMVAIAHDIRTGLTKLRLRTDGRENVPVAEIEPDLAQMERLLSDMMAYARAEHPVAEHELIELRSFIAALAKASPQMIDVTQDKASDPFMIAGSRLAIARMFENLFENARRYGKGWVGLFVERGAAGLTIAVEDNGPGIPEHQLGRVFEPFFRGEASRNKATGGTGLGLGIARAIAHTHGAQIRLSNRSQGGLRAEVVFPAAMGM
ncbi:ATP-binding protein [Porphyrobacter sp. AAP60]|uniref:ATP-binding protein n=1 Tax=Porphyrobacter sp. AAP60 TaxID=1523423 RepID=UPI0018D014B6|nr:ATP-binding protein [Porphyrobacter sp. AAP60]